MYETYQDNPREHKSHTRVIAITFLLALVLVVSVCFLIRAVGKPNQSDESAEPVSSGLIYDSSAVEGGWENLSPEEIEAALNEKVAEGMINISMNTAPYFEDGSAEGNVMIVNEAINNYPQKVEFIRNDTQEVIYASNAIPVGSKIERAKFGFAISLGGGAAKQTDAKNASAQTLLDTAVEGCFMTGVGDQTANSIAVAYDAIVTPVSEAVTNTAIASVLFIIA